MCSRLEENRGSVVVRKISKNQQQQRQKDFWRKSPSAGACLGSGLGVVNPISDSRQPREPVYECNVEWEQSISISAKNMIVIPAKQKDSPFTPNWTPKRKSLANCFQGTKDVEQRASKKIAMIEVIALVVP